jgi:hypothetical protein
MEQGLPTGEFPYLLCWIKMLLVSRDRDILGYFFSSIDEGCGFSLSSFSHFVIYCTKNRRLSYFGKTFSTFLDNRTQYALAHLHYSFGSF